MKKFGKRLLKEKYLLLKKVVVYLIKNNLKYNDMMVTRRRRPKKINYSKFRNSLVNFQNGVINTFEKSFYEENKMFIGLPGNTKQKKMKVKLIKIKEVKNEQKIEIEIKDLKKENNNFSKSKSFKLEHKIFLENNDRKDFQKKNKINSFLKNMFLIDERLRKNTKKELIIKKNYTILYKSKNNIISIERKRNVLNYNIADKQKSKKNQVIKKYLLIKDLKLKHQ